MFYLPNKEIGYSLFPPFQSYDELDYSLMMKRSLVTKTVLYAKF